MGANERKLRRTSYGVLFACCAVCFSTVTLSFNTAGIFYAPASADLGVGTGAFGSYMSVQYLAMSVAMLFGGYIMHRFDARWVLSVCVAMVTAGLLAMSTFTAVWQFYGSAVFIGAANSILLYLMVPTMIDRWFKERVGFFVGLALCFTGIGAMVFNPVGGFVIENWGWRAGYLTFGAISGCVGLVSTVVFVRNSPASLGLERFDADSSDEQEVVKPKEHALSGLTFAQAVRTPALYLVALYAGMMDVGITLNYYLPSYVGTLGHPLIVVSAVASAVMAGQMAGKLLLGWINDRSVKGGVICAVSSGIAGIAIITFLGAVGLVPLVIGSFLFGVFFAGATVTTSLMTRGIFGSRDYDRIFSVVAMVATLSSAFSSAIWGVTIDLTGGYQVMLYLGLAMMCTIYLVGMLACRMGDKTRARYGLADMAAGSATSRDE